MERLSLVQSGKIAALFISFLFVLLTQYPIFLNTAGAMPELLNILLMSRVRWRVNILLLQESVAGKWKTHSLTDCYMKKYAALFALTSFLFLSSVAMAAGIVVKSPDGKILFRLSEQNNQLVFDISFNNIPVITSSPLVFSLDNKIITTGVHPVAAKKSYSIHETYQWYGAHAIAYNDCNGQQIEINKDGLLYSLEVRAFNNGIAFRWIIAGDPAKDRVPDEATVFTLPKGSYLWYHDMEMHYESVHVKKEIAQVQEGEWVAPPATFKLPQGYYASVTEANLVNYPGMSLQADGKNGLMIRLPQHQRASYPYRLRYSPEDTARLQQPAAIRGEITTPWRVIMIGKDLNDMVNNDMVHNLCPPPDKTLFPDGINTSWLKRGRAVWKYLDGGGDGTPEVMKKFTDGAAALGFEHNILEGFWTRWTDEQLRDLVDYSKKKGVGIWLWKHSKSLRSDSARLAFFKHCHDLGIAGAKIDFFDHEAKEVIDLYQSILKEAAQYHVMLDFHGANKPTGLARTWPNQLTYEAVKGMEASKLTDRATHETTIPFTRCLAGPAEYTVVLFGERRKNTTWAHQVASAAILDAPMLTYAASPENLLANPAVPVIKKIPAAWDETIVLPGSEIGELAAYARRKGNTWFVAVMNGVTAKHIKVPLSFLKTGRYKATIVKDDANNPAALIMDKAAYSVKDVIDMDMVPGGGLVVMMEKE